MNFKGVLFIAGGLFAIVCAILDFDWFMDHSRAKFFVKVLTRNGARILYCVVGLILCIIGARML